MKIIRNYILKDFIHSSAFSLLFLSLILMLGNLMQISDLIIRKGINIFDAFTLFSVALPYLLKYVLPISFLLGILLTMGRLISDNEMVSIHIAGISYLKILGLFLFIGLVVSLCLLALYNSVIPEFNYRYHVKIKTIYSKNISAIVEPGAFLDHFENYILYVSDKEGNKLKNVFIYETDESKGSSKVTFAQEGEFVVNGNNLELNLKDGFRDETSEKNPSEFFRINFKIFFMSIPIKTKSAKDIKKKAPDMTIQELKTEIRNLQDKGIKPTNLYTEFHERISFAFSVIALSILAFGISLLVKHRERAINFGIATIAAICYYLFFIMGESLIKYGILTPILGMWLPNIIVILIGGIIIFRRCAL